MALDDDAVTALGAALFEARAARRAIAPLTDTYPDMSVTDAYRVQQNLMARLMSGGDTVAGYKIGLTSAPMQQLLGVDSPDFAPVLATHVNGDGATIGAADFIRPKVEAEIALVLREDLTGPACTEDDARHAVGGARAAIEIVDSRIADWKIKLADTIADLASSGAVALGPTVIDTDGSFDLRLVGMVFTRDGDLVATGAGAAALGSPLAAVAWLANTLHGVGESLRAGQFVMTGSLHAALDIAPGEHYRAEFDRLGAVTLSVV